MRSVTVVISVVLLAGCQRDSTPSSRRDHTQEKFAVQANQVIKVKVTARGEITADDKPVTLEQLATKFAELKKAGGMVWYQRENPTEDPHPNAMKVIELVADNSLPIKLSVKPDFSDAVDAKGVYHPDE